jgi:hypothetical protein
MLSHLRLVLAESGPFGTMRRLIGYVLRRCRESCDRAERAAMSPRGLDRLASNATRALLMPNAGLRNKGAGRRCFVLGSGPSTLDQDLSRLQSEAIIAVNEMFLRLHRAQTAPTLLIFADPLYASPDPGYQNYLEDFALAAARPGHLAMIPSFVAPEISRRGLFAARQPHYFAIAGRLLDYSSAGTVPPLDFTAPIPGLHSVSHVAIALALFMGFKEIVLLGVDLDYLLAPQAPIRHGYGSNPYNSYDSITTKEAFRRGHGWDYPALLEYGAIQLREFTRLGEIASQNGQRILNASPVGLLDMFERRSLDSLLSSPP